MILASCHRLASPCVWVLFVSCCCPWTSSCRSVHSHWPLLSSCLRRRRKQNWSYHESSCLLRRQSSVQLGRLSHLNAGQVYQATWYSRLWSLVLRGSHVSVLPRLSSSPLCLEPRSNFKVISWALQWLQAMRAMQAKPFSLPLLTHSVDWPTERSLSPNFAFFALTVCQTIDLFLAAFWQALLEARYPYLNRVVYLSRSTQAQSRLFTLLPQHIHWPWLLTGLHLPLV